MVDGLQFRTARELFSAFPEATRDMLAVPTDQPPLDFCRALLSGRTPEEAITFCAYLLPRRAAVWWARECLSHLDALFDQQDRDLLALVDAWVGAGNNGHPVLDGAIAAEHRTPAVWIALATTPDPALSPARAVNAGILAALARTAVEDRQDVLGAFVEMGLQLAEDEATQQSAAGA